MRKTSIYLDEDEAQRVADFARREGRSQADVIRAAISAYVPEAPPDREFALFGFSDRIDADPRPISEIPEDELLEGFGA
jgi:ribbon-helix-helix CopG family protein